MRHQQHQTVHSNVGRQQSSQKVKNGVAASIDEVQTKLKPKTLHQVHLAVGDHPKSHHDQIYQILKSIRHVFLLVTIATVQLRSNQNVSMAIGSTARNPVAVLSGSNALTSHTGRSEMVTGNVKITEVPDDVPLSVTTIILFNLLFLLFHHQIQVSDVLRINQSSMDGWSVT